MFRYLVFVLLVSVLTGCSWSNKYTELKVNDVKEVKISIPDELLTSCKPKRPLDKKRYLALKIYEREKYLTNYIIYLYGVIKKCDLRINKIKKLSSKKIKEEK